MSNIQTTKMGSDLTAREKRIAKQWKNGNIKKGILAAKRMNLIQSWNDLQFCQRHDTEYFNKIMSLGGIEN